MRVLQEFVVHRPVDKVWALFKDVSAVVGCVPGASLLEAREDGSYLGRITVKLGPITASFEGTAVLMWVDAEHCGTIDASGADKRGGSRAKAATTFAVTPEGEGSKVVLEAEITISGTAAQFARAGLVTEVATRMIREFAACLEAKLSATTPQEAEAVRASEIRGLPVMGQAIVASLRESLRRKR